MRFWLVLLVVPIVLAGCAHESLKPGAHSPVLGPQPALPQRLSLDDCAHDIIANAALPRLLYSTSQPAGWEEGPSPLIDVRILILECQRLSLDSFGRGPVYFAYETHDNANRASSCEAEGVYESSEIFRNIFVSDGEVAEYMRATYGLPALQANVTYFGGEGDAGQLFENTWTLTPIGGMTSTLTAYNWTSSGLGYGQTDLPVNRFFWENQVGGISYLDFRHTSHSSAYSPRFVNGTLQEPFLHAQRGEDFVTYLGGPIIDIRVKANIVQWRDANCTVPL